MPGATEIVFALGLGDHVVGVTHECDYPDEAKTKSIVVRSSMRSQAMTSEQIDLRVGEQSRKGESLYTIDIDRFKAASPDIILTQDLCNVCAIDGNEVIESCRFLSCEPAIVNLAPQSLPEILADIERIGAATGSEKRARALVRQLTERIEQVRALASQVDSRPRVACLEWLDPIYYAGHWVPEMVELAGGCDVLGQAGEVSAKVGWNQIRDLAPEIVVLMPCGFNIKRALAELPLLQRLKGWNELPAVKGRQVYAVDGNAYFSRPGPRLVDGLEILARLIHPEIFSTSVSP